MTAVAFSQEDDRIYSGGYHEILVWDTEGNLKSRIGNVGQQTFSILIPPESDQPQGNGEQTGVGTAKALPGAGDDSRRYLVVASGSPGFGGDVRLIDLVDQKVTAVLTRCDDVILDLAFRPDGKRLAIASADKTIRILDMDTPQVRQKLLSHADFVTALAWSNDGTRLVSASRDKSAKVFDAETGQLLISYQGMETLCEAFLYWRTEAGCVFGNDRKLHRWNIADAKKTAEVAIEAKGIGLLDPTVTF